MAKMGRPLKEATNLSHDVKVRLDDETYERLLTYCAKNDRQKAEVIREAIKRHINKGK
jgi:predicted DNA-binding protein